MMVAIRLPEALLNSRGAINRNSHDRWYQSVGDLVCRCNGDVKMLSRKQSSVCKALWYSSMSPVSRNASILRLRKFAAVICSVSNNSMVLVAWMA